MKSKRISHRFDPKKLERIKGWINDLEDSKAIDFAIDWTINHIENVSKGVSGENWDIVFVKKKKYEPIKRRVYF